MGATPYPELVGVQAKRRVAQRYCLPQGRYCIVGASSTVYLGMRRIKAILKTACRRRRDHARIL